MTRAKMCAGFLVAFLCSGTALAAAATGQAQQKALETAWTKDLEAASGPSPVQRVVALLQKMKSELDAETANESEMYDKMVCWCETNEKEKTKAIADAEAKDIELSGEIESRSARFGELAATIESLKKQIAEDTKMLNEATAIREKEAAEFREEEKDMVQALTNLKNAIQVLSKHQLLQKSASLLQLESEGPLFAGLRVVLRDVALKYEMLLAGEREQPAPKKTVAALLAVASQAGTKESVSNTVSQKLLSAMDTKANSASELPVDLAMSYVARAAKAPRKTASGAFLQAEESQPLYESRSAGRSAGIFGVLKQMEEEFQNSLSTSQKEESKAAADYEALAAAKEEQISTGKAKLDELQAEDAGNAKALSDAKEDLTLTREQRSKDVKFLQDLKITCGDLDHQFEQRSKTRAAETEAVAETIAILTEDDNREMLAKSVTLLQEGSESSAEARAAAMRRSAAASLRNSAKAPAFDADDLLADWRGRRTAGSPEVSNGPRARLSTLAMAVQLDSFTKVKAMMDQMVADLKTEQEEEVKFKSYCNKELDLNEKTTYEKKQDKKDLETKIEQLEALIEKLAKEIAEANQQIADTEVEIKKASQNREKENAEFQTVVADQRATQEILKKALTRLQDFYVKGKGSKVFLQQGQTPPVQFNKYEKNSGASPVMGMIEQIVEDSKALEKESITTEYQAQADYEKFVKDSNSLIKELTEAVTSKTKATAAAKLDSANAEADLDSTNSELESLAATLGDLHGECDFVLKNFDIRQKARLQEIEAIQAAKGILSGAGSA